MATRKGGQRERERERGSFRIQRQMMMLHELSLYVVISDSKKGSRLRQQRKHEFDLFPG